MPPMPRRSAKRRSGQMRFVVVKDEARQASGVVSRARDVLVRQSINALRGHLTECGHVASKGPAHVATLTDQIEEPNWEENIAVLNVEIKRRSKEDAWQVATDYGQRSLVETTMGYKALIGSRLPARGLHPRPSGSGV
jgi:hypothetical protein